MALETYSGYIFDFDGTLADTSVGIVNTAQESLRRMGLEVSSAEAIRNTIGLPLRESFMLHAHLDSATANEATRLYRDIFMDIALDSVVLYDGVLETLQTLHQRGKLLAVASSRSMTSLPQLVQHLGLQHYLPYLFGEEHAVHPKPAPDLVVRILEQFHLSPREALVIGDTIYDLQMGSSAGCHTCGVTYGNHTSERLRQSHPTLLVDNLTALL